FNRTDVHDFTRRVKYQFGARPELPRHGKFDVFQKLHHLALAVVSLVLIVTGIVLFLNAELFVSMGHDSLRVQRILHDVGAFSLTAIIVGHIYLRLLKSRRAAFRSMVTGNLDREAFEERHDWEQWQPSQHK